MSNAPEPTDELTQRHAALARLRERGIDPYPPTYHRTHTAAEAAALADTPTMVNVAGRLGASRNFGKLAFAHLTDESGSVQLKLSREHLGDSGWALLRNLHAGDVVGAEGMTLRTQKGEASVEPTTITLLAKAQQPPPEKFHGLKDVELRQRRRYLDLLANKGARETFRKRSLIVTSMRRFLDGEGFLEVETPVLQPLYGGATALPFTTYHNNLEQQLYLRISDELYLKRLIVGGFEKVYEIGRDFRNEGLSSRHNPEFTMMELYWAYADYRDIMELTEVLVASIVEAVKGASRLRKGVTPNLSASEAQNNRRRLRELPPGTLAITYQGKHIDFTPPWRQVTMRQALLDATGLDFTQHRDAAALRAAAEARQLGVGDANTWGGMVDELVKRHVEPTLIQPTFLIDYPWELSPLAKRHRDDPLLVERFEPYVAGFEIGNAFSELNDPDDQRERFIEQQKAAAVGDVEAHVLDEEYVLALQHGMPPTGGLGIGIDRLTMLLTDHHSIREVILFPHHRPTDVKPDPTGGAV